MVPALVAHGYTLPRAARSFDDIWRQTPKAVDLGARRQGEAVTYRLDGNAILATSEQVPAPLFEAVRP